MTAQILPFPAKNRYVDLYSQEVSIDGEYFEAVQPALFIANDAFELELGSDIDPMLLATELADFATNSSKPLPRD